MALLNWFGKEAPAEDVTKALQDQVMTLSAQVTELVGTVQAQAAREALAVEDATKYKMILATRNSQETQALVEGFIHKWVEQNPEENIKNWFLQARPNTSGVTDYRMAKVGE